MKILLICYPNHEDSTVKVQKKYGIGNMVKKKDENIQKRPY